MARKIVLAVFQHEGSQLYLSSGDYCTKNADTPSNTLFQSRIISCDYIRAIGFQYWSRGETSSPTHELDIFNGDGFYDTQIVTDRWKGDIVDIYRVDPEAAFSTAVLVGRIIVDTVTTPDDSTLRVVGYSFLEKMDKPINRYYSDSITNDSLRSKAKPISLGNVRWSWPLNPRLNEYPVTAVRGVYDVADAEFECITELRNRGGLVAEAQNPVVTGTNYFTIQDNQGFGYLYVQQEYRHAAQVQGQLRLGMEMLNNGDFVENTDGSPTLPDAWLVSGTGGTIALSSPGEVGFVADGTDELYLYQNLAFDLGAVYYIRLNVVALTGVMDIVCDGSIVRSIDSVGSYVVSACYVGTRSAIAPFKIGFNTGSSGSATITAVECLVSYRINTLSEIMQFVAIERNVLTSTELDLSAAAAIELETPYVLNFFTRDEISGKELLARAAASYGCSLYQTRTGAIRSVRFQAPAVTPDYVLLEVDIDGSLNYEPDTAPGLSNRIKYAYNANVHSIDDMVQAPATTAGNPAIRAELSSEFKVATATVSLHGNYADALTREPLESLLTLQSDALAEVNRACGVYSVSRGFYKFDGHVRGTDAYLIEPGETVQLFNSRYGLSAGKNLLVVYARSSYVDDKTEFLFWG